MEKADHRQHSKILAILFIFYGGAHLLAVSFVWLIFLVLAAEAYLQLADLKRLGLTGVSLLLVLPTAALRVLIAEKKVVGQRCRNIDMPGDFHDQLGRANTSLTAQVEHEPCHLRDSLWWSKYGAMSVWDLVRPKEGRLWKQSSDLLLTRLRHDHGILRTSIPLVNR
jgi:hypothetical protein